MSLDERYEMCQHTLQSLEKALHLIFNRYLLICSFEINIYVKSSILSHLIPMAGTFVLNLPRNNCNVEECEK